MIKNRLFIKRNIIIFLVISLFLNMNIFVDGYVLCYQEFANVSTACGGLNTGSYWNDTGLYIFPSKTYDGDWATEGHATAGATKDIFINYTKPVHSNNALWRIKDYAGENNLSIPNDCFDTYPNNLTLKVRSISSANDIEWYCHNSSDWDKLRFYGTSNEFYEEGVYWGLPFYKNDVIYNSSTYETKNESFIISLTYDSGNYTNINVVLTYNNSNYSTIKSGSGNNVNFSFSLGIPIYNQTVINNFYWNIGLTNATGTYYYQSDTYNQTVIVFTDLVTSSSCNNKSLAINFDDEINFTSLNVTFDYNFIYHLGSNVTKSLYGSLTGVTDIYICTNFSIPYNVTLDYGELQYKLDNYITRKYYFFDGYILTNETQNITLYDLDESKATSFLFEFEDTSLNPYTNRYTSLLRWYPDLDSYRVVEMGQTDEKGQTVMRVKVDDTDYRVGLYHINGSLIKLLSAVRFTCLSDPCEYTTIIEETPSDYTSFFGVESSLNFNYATNVWTYVFNDPSQLTDEMRLIVTRETPTSSFIICNTSTSGYTGALTCNSSLYTGTIKGVAFRTASPTTILASRIINTANTPFKGDVGLFVSIIVVITLALIGIFSPVIAIIFAIVALVPAYFIGSINLTILIGIAVLGGIVIHFLKRTG